MTLTRISSTAETQIEQAVRYVKDGNLNWCQIAKALTEPGSVMGSRHLVINGFLD